MSVRKDIRDRVILELNAAPPAGVPEATRRRYVPGTVVSDPRLAVFFLEEEVSDAGAGSNSPVVRRAMFYGIQAVASVEDPADADDALDPLLEHVVAIMGETRLNGLATKIKEVSTIWQTGEAGLFVIAALTRWRIEFQTRRADLTLKQ